MQLGHLPTPLLMVVVVSGSYSPWSVSIVVPLPLLALTNSKSTRLFSRLGIGFTY